MLTELVELPGGSFRMGSTSFYPEEAPVHSVTVGSFAVERHPVINALRVFRRDLLKAIPKRPPIANLTPNPPRPQLER
jgi:Sulfatase-modifying factor enzyme 1